MNEHSTPLLPDGRAERHLKDHIRVHGIACQSITYLEGEQIGLVFHRTGCTAAYARARRLAPVQFLTAQRRFWPGS